MDASFCKIGSLVGKVFVLHNWLQREFQAIIGKHLETPGFDIVKIAEIPKLPNNSHKIMRRKSSVNSFKIRKIVGGFRVRKFRRKNIWTS